MCMSLRHVDFLDTSNEDDYRFGRISYETYIRMADITARCRQCDRMDNGEQGDMLDECRTTNLRLMGSLNRDAEARIREKRAAGQGAEPSARSAVAHRSES